MKPNILEATRRTVTNLPEWQRSRLQEAGVSKSTLHRILEEAMSLNEDGDVVGMVRAMKGVDDETVRKMLKAGGLASDEEIDAAIEQVKSEKDAARKKRAKKLDDVLTSVPQIPDSADAETIAKIIASTPSISKKAAMDLLKKETAARGIKLSKIMLQAHVNKALGVESELSAKDFDNFADHARALRKAGLKSFVAGPILSTEHNMSVEDAVNGYIEVVNKDINPDYVKGARTKTDRRLTLNTPELLMKDLINRKVFMSRNSDKLGYKMGKTIRNWFPDLSFEEIDLAVKNFLEQENLPYGKSVAPSRKDIAKASDVGNIEVAAKERVRVKAERLLLRKNYVRTHSGALYRKVFMDVRNDMSKLQIADAIDHEQIKQIIIDVVAKSDVSAEDAGPIDFSNAPLDAKKAKTTPEEAMVDISKTEFEARAKRRDVETILWNVSLRRGQLARTYLDFDSTADSVGEEYDPRKFLRAIRYKEGNTGYLVIDTLTSKVAGAKEEKEILKLLRMLVRQPAFGKLGKLAKDDIVAYVADIQSAKTVQDKIDELAGVEESEYFDGAGLWA